MKTKRSFLVFVLFLLVLPSISATTEGDQLNHIISKISLGLPYVRLNNWNCLNDALSLLQERMGEMVGMEGFLNEITNPISWARQLLPFKVDFAISAIQKLADDLKGYTDEGNQVITTDYSPGWIRRYVKDDCESFSMKFFWLKSLNKVRVVAAGKCNCHRDLKDFYLQFDVAVRENPDVDDDEPHKYDVIGFSNSGTGPGYLLDPDDEANSVIKVNCCKACGHTINWKYDEEEEVGYKSSNSLFADPDEFLAALESGKFSLTSEQREDFMKDTLCSKIDVIPKQIKDPTSTTIPDPKSTTIPDPISTTVPDPTSTTTPDPVKTPVKDKNPTGPTPDNTGTTVPMKIQRYETYATKDELGMFKRDGVFENAREFKDGYMVNLKVECVDETKVPKKEFEVTEDFKRLGINTIEGLYFKRGCHPKDNQNYCLDCVMIVVAPEEMPITTDPAPAPAKLAEDGYCENLYLRKDDPDPDCAICQKKIDEAKEKSKQENPEFAACPFINTQQCKSCYFKVNLDNTVANCGGTWKLTTTDPCG